MTAGLAIWCTPTASLMHVRDGDYDAGGTLLAFAGSVQLLWLVVAVFVLPIHRRATTPAATTAAAPARVAHPEAAHLETAHLETAPLKIVLPIQRGSELN